jgi:hypothetical protein
MSLILSGSDGLSDIDGSASTPAIRGTDANCGVFFGVNTVSISTDGTAAVTVDSGQRTKFPTTIGVGNATPSTSGSGVSFPATQSASTDANTLDDYEEGTWTPTYTTDGNNFTSVTYTFNNGSYQKIGNTVYISGILRTNAITVGIANGNVLIGGLPFTVATADPRGVISLGYSAGFAGDEPLQVTTQPITTTAYMYYKTAVNGDSSTMQVSDMGTGAGSNFITFSGFYTV